MSDRPLPIIFTPDFTHEEALSVETGELDFYIGGILRNSSNGSIFRHVNPQDDIESSEDNGISESPAEESEIAQIIAIASPIIIGAGLATWGIIKKVRSNRQNNRNELINRYKKTY